MRIVHAIAPMENIDIADAPREYVTLLKDESAFEEEQLRKDLEADGYEVMVFYYKRVPGSPSDMALPFMTTLVAE
jgi:hypothetical protein